MRLYSICFELSQKKLYQQAEVWELKTNSKWHLFDENFGEDVKSQDHFMRAPDKMSPVRFQMVV